MPKNTKTKKAEMKQIKRFCSAEYNTHEDGHKPVKSKEQLHKMVEEESLQQEHINDNDIL